MFISSLLLFMFHLRFVIILKIIIQRSRDSGGRDEGTEVKQQISSLEYVKKIIDSRIHRLDKGSETDSVGKRDQFQYI